MSARKSRSQRSRPVAARADAYAKAAPAGGLRLLNELPDHDRCTAQRRADLILQFISGDGQLSLLHVALPVRKRGVLEPEDDVTVLDGVGAEMDKAAERNRFVFLERSLRSA